MNLPVSKSNARAGRQYIVSGEQADILKALLAVWLGLISPYVIRIFKYPFLCLLQFSEGEAPSPEETRPINQGNNETASQNTTPAPQNGNASGIQHTVPARWQRASSVLAESKSGRELFEKTARYMYESRFSGPHGLALILIGLLILASFAARAVVGVLSAFVATDTTALWYSTECGPYVFDSIGAGDDIAARADVYDREKETRAGAYAKYCYHNLTTSTRPLHCNFFSTQKIPFTTAYDYRCPFPRQDICARGAQAVTFDTGLVDAAVTGINDPYGYKFRRTTTCVPLSTEAPYVRNETADGIPEFSYLYGERIGRKDTFHSVGDPFNWLAPTYDVRSVHQNDFPP